MCCLSERNAVRSRCFIILLKDSQYFFDAMWFIHIQTLTSVKNGLNWSLNVLMKQTDPGSVCEAQSRQTIHIKRHLNETALWGSAEGKHQFRWDLNSWPSDCGAGSLPAELPRLSEFNWLYMNLCQCEPVSLWICFSVNPVSVWILF